MKLAISELFFRVELIEIESFNDFKHRRYNFLTRDLFLLCDEPFLEWLCHEFQLLLSCLCSMEAILEEYEESAILEHCNDLVAVLTLSKWLKPLNVRDSFPLARRRSVTNVAVVPDDRGICDFDWIKEQDLAVFASR